MQPSLASLERRPCHGGLLAFFAPILVLGLVAEGASARESRLEPVTVYAAMSLTDCLREVASAFERETGQSMLFNFGASNELARQIEAGAPADVFFSADKAQMDSLEKMGLVRSKDRVEVLSNVLVVAVPRASAVRIQAPRDLLSFRVLALADPEGVPAGVYARMWLESAGLWNQVKDRVVPTLNVRSALAAVESGNADAAVVYRTDAALSTRVRVAFEVSGGAGPEIRYPLAPVATSTHPATPSVVRYLGSETARQIYRKFGFLVLGD